MPSPNRLLLVAALMAVAAPAPALAEPLVYNPHQPGYHPGPPAYYERYRIFAPDWFERRDTVTLQAGDAIAANKAMMMRDPWPPYVGNRNIQFHGEVMAGAVERYKTNTVTRPIPLTATLGR